MLCSGRKKSARLYLSVVIFFWSFWSFGINDSNIFSVENWIPHRPMLGDVRDVALLHYISWTDSIKQSLQFSFINFGLIALERSTFSRIPKIDISSQLILVAKKMFFKSFSVFPCWSKTKLTIILERLFIVHCFLKSNSRFRAISWREITKNNNLNWKLRG